MATDRATMGDIMKTLNGYTLCPGILCRELHGDDYAIVPFRDDDRNPNRVMEIGYIRKKYASPSEAAERYIEELRKSIEINTVH